MLRLLLSPLRFLKMITRVKYLLITLVSIMTLFSAVVAMYDKLPPYAQELITKSISTVTGKAIEKAGEGLSLSADSKAAKIKVEEATVTKHVDGDTFYAKMKSDGKEYKIRLIGVNCPESTTKIQPYGKEASAYTKKKLMGKKVYLEKDAGNKDKYGRLLRYCWLSKPTSGDDKEASKKMFNAILVTEGYAQVMTIQPNVKYQSLFVKLQRVAKESNKGLWGIEK